MVKEASKPGFKQLWFRHWLAGALISLVFGIGLFYLEGFPPVRALDRWGSDAAMRVHSATWAATAPGRPVKVVMVELDAPVEIARLAETLELIRQAKPMAVGLDLAIQEPSDETMIDPLAKELSAEWGMTPIALPVPGEKLSHALRKGSTVRVAAPDLVPDDDGVVRTMSESTCTDTLAGLATRQTLAAVVVLQSEPDSDGCIEGETWPILFAPVLPVPEPGAKAAPGNGVVLLPEAAVASHSHLLEGAYVVLGHAGWGWTADTFLTPVGPMAGALIHAQAVLTLAREVVPDGKGGRIRPTEGLINSHVARIALEAVVALLAGIFFSFYAACLHKISVPEPDTARFSAVALSFLAGLLGLVLGCGVLLILGVGWTYMAGRLVGSGLFIGTLVPVFGAMLELLAEGGQRMVAIAEWLAVWVVQPTLRRLLRRTTPVALAMLCLFPAGVAAQGCQAELTRIVSGDAEDVRVQPGNRPAFQRPVKLEPFQRVEVLKQRTTVLIERRSEGETSEMTVQGRDPPERGALTLPPCPPVRAGIKGAWDAFWGPLNPSAPMRRSGTTPVYRGSGDGGGLPELSGRLRELANLTPATGVVGGAQGLALAWAGGSPPYVVAVEDEANGAPLGQEESVRPGLWWPDWQVPDRPIVIIVRDAEGVELWRHLVPLTVAALPDGDTADAIMLFQDAPAYRLEALRRLEARAAGGDELARHAIEMLQSAGAVE